MGTLVRPGTFAALVGASLAFGAAGALATEGPATPAEAMDRCCADLFGKWRGKGWMTAPVGGRIDMDVEIEMVRSADGGSATLIADYTPLRAGEGRHFRRIARLTYSGDWINQRPYTFRYLWGGPFWGVRDFDVPTFVPIRWTEPAPGGGVIRYLTSSTETEWFFAGFCCSGEDSDRLSFYVLVTRVGAPGKKAFPTAVRYP